MQETHQRIPGKPKLPITIQFTTTIHHMCTYAYPPLQLKAPGNKCTLQIPQEKRDINTGIKTREIQADQHGKVYPIVQYETNKNTQGIQ